MPDLQWIEASSGAVLPSGSVLSPGKVAVMHGNSYSKSRHPKFFKLYRVPSKLVAWSLAQFRRPPEEELARSRAIRNPISRAPRLVLESAPVVLTTAGLVHAHRWQFSAGSHRSPVIRTARVLSIRLNAAGAFGPGTVSISATVAASTDPDVRIEMVTSWSEVGREVLTSLLAEELQELSSPGIRHDLQAGEFVEDNEIGISQTVPTQRYVVEPSYFVPMSFIDAALFADAIREFLPDEPPFGFSSSFEPQEIHLEEGDRYRLNDVVINGRFGRPFVIGFVARDISTSELIGSSEFVIISDQGVFFSEG